MKKAILISGFLAGVFAAAGAATSQPCKNGAVLLAVDATAPGRVLPNVSKMLALWDLDGETFRDVARYREHDVLEFAEYVEIFGATGGNDVRDCLKNPRDRTVLDDYDFSRLVAGCRNIVHLGLKPYLKLGNVPNKFTTHNNPGAFGMNIRPPTDYAVYGRYMEACANALLDAFGREELLKWRFAVLTEFGNEQWFKDASGDKEKSFRAYCRLYETTLDAFRKVISPDVIFGAHATAAKARVVWDERKFIRYAGERKLPLKFISVSFYDDCPGRFTRNWDFPGRIKHVRDAAMAAGYTNLWYGVDEGRIMYGTSRGHRGNRELPHRVVGDTWQAAYDARMVKQMFDHDVDYFASWGYLSGPYGFFEGLPTVSFHVAREAAKFRGMRRLSVSATKRDVPGVEVDAVAAASDDGRVVRVMAYAFKNDLHAAGKVPLGVSVKLPPAWKEREVRVVRTTVDDDANWFDDWRRIREERGIGDERFGWSPDGSTPTAFKFNGLRSPKDCEMFRREIEPQLRDCAKLKPIVERMKVNAEGLAALTAEIPVNSVVSFELSRDEKDRVHVSSGNASLSEMTCHKVKTNLKTRRN